MTAEMVGRFAAAPVRGDRPVWSAAEVVITAPPAELPARPSVAELFVQLVTAPGAPSFDGVERTVLDHLSLTRLPRLTLLVDTRLAFLGWTGFLGLDARAERLERRPGEPAHLVRAGRVIVAGHRLGVAVHLELGVSEIGR